MPVLSPRQPGPTRDHAVFGFYHASGPLRVSITTMPTYRNPRSFTMVHPIDPALAIL